MAQAGRGDEKEPATAKRKAPLSSRESAITDRTSLRDVAFIVCTALHNAGLSVVLTGGGAATVYAPEAVQSGDLDFVVTLSGKGTGGGVNHGAVLEKLGYRRVNDGYVHETSKLALEFPPGPLAIADELITKWDVLLDGKRRLNILTPTDSCRDRLASFVFWNDRSGLEQALALAQVERDRVDLKAIQDWCQRQGSEEKFLQFMRELRIRTHGTR